MASDPEPGFLAALREQPYDNDTRLVYADWLEEHGHGDRAAYLRLHVLGRDRVEIDSLYALERRLNAEAGTRIWMKRVDPRAARCHPHWLAAVLGDDAARDRLGGFPPPRLVDTPIEVATYPEVFGDWPASVLARLALAASRHALLAVRQPALDPEVDHRLGLLGRVEAVLAARTESPVATPFAAELLLLVPQRYVRPLKTARWHGLLTASFAARAAGPYDPAGHSDTGVPQSTALAIIHARATVIELVWERGDTRHRHRRADHLERIATAAVARAARWGGSHRGELARLAHEGWDPDDRAAVIRASAHRARALASARLGAAERARAASPPPPDTGALERALLDSIAATVLGWLAAQPSGFLAHAGS